MRHRPGRRRRRFGDPYGNDSADRGSPGELTDGIPERGDTDWIVAEEARRLVQGLDLPVDR